MKHHRSDKVDVWQVVVFAIVLLLMAGIILLSLEVNGGSYILEDGRTVTCRRLVHEISGVSLRGCDNGESYHGLHNVKEVR